ncbi:MAG: hypothetical protein RMJ19_06000 [Gemmatales bacterium]|nr:hypothetical protein [Gemmatales bacterium]MDW8175205.1 hypothetical protein [Gemmatales bacterium]MDW8222983.1 hypothetical protein [Gemmatales bacterium]
MAELWQGLLELTWWLRLLMSVAAFLGGAVLAGWLLALSTWALRRETSKRTRLVTRLSGGTLAGLLTWLFLHFAPVGSGSGSGSGTSMNDLTEHIPSSPQQVSEEPPPPLPPEKTRGPLASTLASSGKWVLRLKLLGPESSPRYEPPDRYFSVIDAIASDPIGLLSPNPTLPNHSLNADSVLHLVKEFQSQGIVEAVELHVTPFSTSLKNHEVAKLRRLLMEAKVRLEHPDPDNPKYSPLVGR